MIVVLFFQVGWFIKISIPNVPKAIWESYTDYKNLTPFGAMIVFGLLPNEHKMSVVNTVLKRTGISDEPIKSKEKLLIQCGYRRYVVSPIFSQHTNGPKHKVPTQVKKKKHKLSIANYFYELIFYCVFSMKDSSNRLLHV